MKKIKEILKYVGIFIVAIVILLILIVLAAKIPKKYVDENLKDAVAYFEENPDEISGVEKNKYLWTYPHADQIALNIIYCLDENNSLASIMESKYYSKDFNDTSNLKYVELVRNDLEPNAQYLRYWQGQILFLKPLLVFLTLEQIYILNIVVLIILLLLLFGVLIKYKYWSIVLSLVIGLIMTASWVIPNTIAYMATYVIMIIACFFAVIIEQKELGNNKLYILFFVTGILTCFFDVLTTEIITLLVPLLIVLTMRMKNKKFDCLKEQFKFLVKSGTLWFIAYVCTWLAKWILASIILNLNAFDYVKNQAMQRVNGTIGSWSNFEIMLMAIRNNFYNLVPIYNIAEKSKYLILIIIIPILSIILTMDGKDNRKMSYLLLMAIIALIPYARYAILSNHSFLHSFFTFRCQLSTIMCIILVFVNCMDINKMFKEVKLKNKDK